MLKSGRGHFCHRKELLIMSSMFSHLDSYITYLKAQEYAPNTMHSYRKMIEEFLSFNGGISAPDDVTPTIVESWFVSHSEGWNVDTKRLHILALRAFFQYLTEKRVYAENPFSILANVKPKKRIDESAQDDKEDKVYSPDELLSLINFDGIRFKGQLLRDRAIISLMAATGMRASEVAWLNVGQVRNRSGNTIFALRKGQNIRKIFVADFAFDAIDQYLATRGILSDDDPLFITRCGNRIDRHTIYNILATRQKAIGVRTGTHNIRYTVLNSVERYADAVVARDLAGQKSISVTNTYMVSSNEERAAAVGSLPWAKELSKK